MIYRNSLKITANNFGLVWKQLVYILFCMIIVVSLSSVCALPVFNMLSGEGWMNSVSELIETVYTSPKNFSDGFTAVFSDLFFLLKDNFGSLWINYVLIVFIVIFVSVILSNMSLFFCSAIVDMNMSSLSPSGYVSTVCSNFFNAFKFAVVKYILGVPFFALSVLVIIGFCLVSKTWLLSLILFPILIAFLIFISAFKRTTFVCFIPEILNNSKRSVWKNFAKNIILVKSNFGKILSNSVCLTLTVVLFNVISAIFTLGAGLIVSVPTTYVLYASYSLACYYLSNGKRFYINEHTFVDSSSTQCSI